MSPSIGMYWHNDGLDREWWFSNGGLHSALLEARSPTA